MENPRTIEIFQRENMYIESAEESHVIFVTNSFENLNAYAFDFSLLYSLQFFIRNFEDISVTLRL